MLDLELTRGLMLILTKEFGKVNKLFKEVRQC